MATRCSRRSFIKLGAAGSAALFLPWGFGPGMAVAQIPGGTLDPRAIPKYRTPLLVPPAMPRAGKFKMRGGKSIDYYEIAVRQFEQQMPAGRTTGDDRLGVRSTRRPGRWPPDLQRPIAHDRGEERNTGPRQVGE